MSKKRRPSEEDTDHIVVSQVDDDSAWEKPMRAVRGNDLLNSGLVELWEKRKDIGDSVAFARNLRVKAQARKKQNQ